MKQNVQGSGIFNNVGIGDDMPFFVDNKPSAASRVKPANFDLYRHDGWADVAIDVRLVLRPK